MISVGRNRRAHERIGLIQAPRGSRRTLAGRDEGVGVGRHIPVAVLRVLDLLLHRQILQIVFQVIRLERFTERQLLRVSDACERGSWTRLQSRVSITYRRSFPDFSSKDQSCDRKICPESERDSAKTRDTCHGGNNRLQCNSDILTTSERETRGVFCYRRCPKSESNNKGQSR